MRYLFPPDDQPIDESWWAPLRGVARAVAGDPRYQFFDTHDFMMMCGINRRPRPRVILYKHRYTRHYLNLDDAGHAYRYIPRRKPGTGPGRYVLHRDLHAALDALGLWELPWMKDGLEEHRRGLSWEQRWSLHPDLHDDEWFDDEGEPGWSSV